MTAKWIGAILIILGCGGTGFAMAAAHRKEEGELRQLLTVLDFMQCELQYRMTPLPDLCRHAAAQVGGSISRLFASLAEELEDQIAPDVWHCMKAALSKTNALSASCVTVAEHMGKTLGRFDMGGQIRGLEAARQDCRRMLEQLNENRDVRLRSYQTLGLCTGAALAILFV